MTRRPPTRGYRVADLVADVAAERAAARTARQAAAAATELPTPPAGSSPVAAAPASLSAPDEVPLAATETAADPRAPVAPRPEARPTIDPEPAILGLSRHARSKLGSRLFVWFFVFVYAVILIQLVVALWQDT